MKLNWKCLTRQAARAGFTLIEILLVLALLGTVMSIFGGKLFSAFGRGKTSAARLQIKQIEGSLDRYRLDCGSYPTSDQGLGALATPPSGGKQCKDYDPEGYLGGSKNIPKDPWGNDFKYTCDDGFHYKIVSYGQEGVGGGKEISSDDSK